MRHKFVEQAFKETTSEYKTKLWGNWVVRRKNWNDFINEIKTPQSKFMGEGDGMMNVGCEDEWYLACDYEVGWWRSKKPCCNSCMEDKEDGYDDIDGCCCIHMGETEAERGKIYKTPEEAEEGK